MQGPLTLSCLGRSTRGAPSGGGNLDSATPSGELMLQILGAIAEIDHATMLERQREGIGKAKADGKYKGRKLSHV